MCEGILAVAKVKVALPPVPPLLVDPRKNLPSVKFVVVQLTLLPAGIAAPLQYIHPLLSTDPESGMV